MNALDRARRVRAIAAELADLLLDQEVTHFEVRFVLGGLLEATGVQGVTTGPDGTREWTFEDGVVEERHPSRLGAALDPRVRDCGHTLVRLLRDHPGPAAVLNDLARLIGVSSVFTDRPDIDAAAVAYGEAIRQADATDEDAVAAVRLSLRGVLEDARLHVPDAWQAAVLHEIGAVIRSPLRRGRYRVTEGVLDVLVEDGALTATLMPDNHAELERMWGAAEVEGWFAPGRPHQASSGRRMP